MNAKRRARPAAADETQSPLARRIVALLAKRELSTHEARERLRTWGAAEPAAARVISDLVAAGALDDQRAAESFCRSTLARRAVSREWLLSALARHGIAGSLARNVVDVALDGQSTQAQARNLAAQAASRHPPDLALVSRRRRLLGLLARRGFDQATATQAVLAVLPGDDADS